MKGKKRTYAVIKKYGDSIGKEELLYRVMKIFLRQKAGNESCDRR